MPGSTGCVKRQRLKFQPLISFGEPPLLESFIRIMSLKTEVDLYGGVVVIITHRHVKAFRIPLLVLRFTLVIPL